MKYQIDHDLHIHSMLSSCSGDPLQTKERILEYAKQNGLKKICVTDHLWDSKVPGASNWYLPQNYEHSAQILPLPQDEQVEFYFGCETDMDKYFTLGLHPSSFDDFAFINVPTTHLHMTGFTIDEADMTLEGRKRLYIERLDKLLEMDLPFFKMGLAHPVCHNIALDFADHCKVLDRIDDATFARLYTKLAQKGMGFELNLRLWDYSPAQLESVMRPHRIAKACGCKFYLGCDAHHPEQLDGARAKFERMIDLLALTEEDKFRPLG